MGASSELHLSAVKAVPAKLFSVEKAHESHYALASNPILSSEIQSALAPPLSINVVLVKWLNEWCRCSKRPHVKQTGRTGVNPDNMPPLATAVCLFFICIRLGQQKSVG